MCHQFLAPTGKSSPRGTLSRGIREERENRNDNFQKKCYYNLEMTEPSSNNPIISISALLGRGKRALYKCPS